MAGNKINSKTKGKDDRNKGNKNGGQNEEPDDLDFSMLRKPIQTNVTGFAQARKIFDLGTEELKELLTNECDLLYECKVCRNIFRSLINFLSHKRVYCKEKFCSSQHGHFISNSSMMKEFLKIKHIEDGYQQCLKAKEEIIDDDERIPMSKDLTAVMEGITKTKGQLVNLPHEVQQVTLQKIPNSSIAVFQSVNTSDGQNSDLMRTQVHELDAMLSRDKAVLQSDGKFQVQSSTEPETEGVIQISDDEDTEGGGAGGDGLRCNICNLQFSTQKTLKFHMKYKHVESRLVYPCPDCVDIFSTSWSVYRHLFKVHRKSAAQIRRLRESIQSKAFKMNNPPAFYEKKKNNMKPAIDVKKISEEERQDQENQAWLSALERGGRPRCAGCGRAFERRAALHAHAAACARRARAARPARPGPGPGVVQPARPIHIHIRRDYAKGDDADNKVPPDENARSPFKRQKEPETKTLEEATMFIEEDSQASLRSNKDSASGGSPEQSNDSVSESHDIKVEPPDETPNTTEDSPPDPPENAPPETNKLPSRASFVDRSEKISGNMVSFKQKLQSKGDIDLGKLLCKICNFKYKTQSELCDHMATTHYKWVRYSCKLCNCKDYFFDKISEHVRTVHKLKGDADFYHSTVKALDGNDALELYESSEDVNEENVASPVSRRASRCSSDSSRLSDDSSTSLKLDATSRKRKIKPCSTQTKRKKESTNNKEENLSQSNKISLDKVLHHMMFGDADPNANVKPVEENSSDLEEIEDKLVKRMSNDVDRSSVATRRPVRKRTKPKNEDFEYDLSNLLKMEAQGYRESKEQVNVTKMTQNKKKPQTEVPTAMDNINKDFIGALLNMSKKSVEFSAAHIKPFDMSIFNVTKEARVSYPFVKPMLPKVQPKLEKTPPKKDAAQEKDVNKNIAKDNPNDNFMDKIISEIKIKKNDETLTSENSEKETNSTIIKTNATMLPIKFHREGLELMKNPIINKNISELSKAGMKTKILVIKPINRQKDGPKSLLKFQTIKLKEHIKGSTDSNKNSDQVMVVKMPTVNVPTPANSIDDDATNESNVIKNNQDITKESINEEDDCATKDDVNNRNVKMIDDKIDHDDDSKITDPVITDKVSDL